MKIIEWGLFVELEDGSTTEVVLPEQISEQISKYLDSDEVEYLNETNGKLNW